MSSLPFEGFARPQSNFYRLPLSWFDTLRALRARHDRRRIVALVRLTEYIIKWTWGQGNYQGMVRLTLDEIEHGRVIGRRDGVRLRADSGTGMPRKTLIPTIEDGLAYGLLTRATDDRDRARVRQAYAVRLAAEELAARDERFAGFPAPTTNYFIVPNLWTDLTAGVRSDVLILAVEYLFRHCWNWSRQDEVHWLTSDEIANGRRRGEDPAGDGSRYDEGIGYAERKVRDALEQAVANEWIVWRATPRGGRTRTEYTLRRTGWPAGSWQEPRMPSSAVPDVDDAPWGPKVTPGVLTPLAVGRLAAVETGPKVTPDGPKVTSGRPKVTSARPNVTKSGPKVDPDQIYQPVPTQDTNDLTPPPDTGPVAASSRPLGGGVEPPASRGAMVMPANTDRQRLEYLDGTSGARVVIEGLAWPGDRVGGATLPADQVVVCDPAQPENAVVVTAEEAARLLWSGLPRPWLYWDPAWLADPRARDDRGDAAWDAAAYRREELVEDILAVMQSNAARWGHWDLREALRRCGIAPERVEALLSAHGRPLVGAWLADLRHDPSVQSVAAVLISNLRKGLTPPSLAHRPRTANRPQLPSLIP